MHELILTNDVYCQACGNLPEGTCPICGQQEHTMTDEMRAGKIAAVTYGQSVYDLAMEYVTDQAEDQELQAHADRYADDLAQTISDAISDWIDDRLNDRPLLYKPTHARA